MYKYFYKINEPTSGENENELQITCHRARVYQTAKCHRMVCNDSPSPRIRCCACGYFLFLFFFLWIEPFLHLTHAHTHSSHDNDFFPRSSCALSLSFDYFTFAQLIRISHPEHLQKNGKVTKNEQSEKKKNSGRRRRFTPKTNAIISYKNEQQQRRQRRGTNERTNKKISSHYEKK